MSNLNGNVAYISPKTAVLGASAVKLCCKGAVAFALLVVPLCFLLFQHSSVLECVSLLPAACTEYGSTQQVAI